MSQYSRVNSPYEGGRYSNPGMIALIKTFCAIMGFKVSQMTCFQGSFNTTVEASAGTHDKADCLDISALNYARKIQVLRSIGAFAFHRTKAQGFGEHIHLGRMFSTAMAWLATAQDNAYRKYKSDGLGDLSHTDRDWTPRYRSVRHLKGPTTSTFFAVRATPGYSQAGGTPIGDKDLVKVTRARKSVLGNIAGTVRCNGKDYFVTNSLTFFLVSDFIKAFGGFVWKSQDYSVGSGPAYGRTGPGAAAPKRAGCVRARGYLICSIGYADRDGLRFVVTSHGTYYAESSLRKI